MGDGPKNEAKTNLAPMKTARRVCAHHDKVNLHMTLCHVTLSDL